MDFPRKRSSEDMEVTEASWVALSLVFVSVLVRWAWNVLDWVWLKPKKLESCLRDQGLKGNSYRFLHGDMKENSVMINQAKSKPMIFSHDIASRVEPFIDQTVKTYGKNSFVWIVTTPRVNIMNPKDVKDIFTKHSDFQQVASNGFTKLLVRGLASHTGEKWAKHRRIINPEFHLEKQKLMMPAFHQSIDEMIKEWESAVSKKGSSAELDVWPSLQSMTADVISRTAFGTSYQEGRKIFELQKEQAVYLSKAVRGYYIPGWRFLPTKMNMRMKEINKEVKSIIEGMIKKREQAIKAGHDASKHDMLGALVESSLKDIEDHGKNAGMSIDDVIEECKFFYSAGQETTAVLLVWTIILLSQYQTWQNRAREEVLKVFGSKQPDFNGLSDLKVVTMILLEVLRLYPALVEMNRSTLKETQHGEFSLPAGVELRLPVLLIHHDKELWGDDANEFKPERFAEGVSKATKGQFSFIPFGGGPRICIGQHFAMTEVKLALGLILQQFTFEISSSYIHAPFSQVFLHPQYGAPIILRRR